MLEVGDAIHHEELKGKSLLSVYRFSPSQWNCILNGGRFLQIRFKNGILGMTTSETEYGIGQEIMIVGIDQGRKNIEFSKRDLEDMSKDEMVEIMLLNALSNKNKENNLRKSRKPLSFYEIMDFMSWKCKEENIWDCSI